jgi:nucleoside phosphorylase
MTNLELLSTLVVLALEDEAQSAFAREPVFVLYTGVGKVNATMWRPTCQHRYMPHALCREGIGPKRSW